MSSLSRYWHTLKYLKPVQLYGRVLFRLRRPIPDLRPAPPRRVLAPFALPARRRPSLLAPDTFRFLNVTHDLDGVGWDDASIDKLWRYNLHYFDDLNAEAAEVRQAWHAALLDRWVGENRPGTGSGWEPYPVSLRVVNWIKWAQAGNSVAPAVLHSLAVQVRWLARRIEHHLLGNHLLVNAKALVMAGWFFEGDEAEAWVEQGMRILARELPEQTLADGAQFELSPMYHALALEDTLDLVNAAVAAGVEETARWREIASRQVRWLQAMCHPDGEISFFNDAAIGVAPSPADLFAYADRLGISPAETRSGSVIHMQSGYVRAEWDGAVALLDVAQVGPDYLPAHAHADTLSFELSVFRRRCLVNSGTSRYGIGPERNAERGTAAHNTVVVDGEDSSEVWSGFRVARRARPSAVHLEPLPQPHLRASHDGYTRLPGRPVHSREWRFLSHALQVEDRITSRRSHHAVARFHLHPEVKVVTMDGGAAVLRMDGGTVTVTVTTGRLSLEPAAWHPEFGLSIPTRCLVVTLESGQAITEFRWEAFA